MNGKPAVIFLREDRGVTLKAGSRGSWVFIGYIRYIIEPICGSLTSPPYNSTTNLYFFFKKKSPNAKNQSVHIPAMRHNYRVRLKRESDMQIFAWLSVVEEVSSKANNRLDKSVLLSV